MKMSKLQVPTPDYELQGAQFLLRVPGAPAPAGTASASYLSDPINGPLPSVPPAANASKMVESLGGPLSAVFTETAAVGWQGNFFGYGSVEDLQGSLDPRTNMNSRKVLYSYRRKSDGSPDPPPGGFRVFLMFDFLFWADDPDNPLGFFGLTSSAPHVDKKAAQWPWFTSATSKIHNWPKRWVLAVVVATAAALLGLLVAVASRSPARGAVVVALTLLAGLVAYYSQVLLAAKYFNTLDYCAFFDKPSCWTGLPDLPYEDPTNTEKYLWKSDLIRTFGGLPEIGASWGYQYRARLLQYLVANGFAVVAPGFSNVRADTRNNPENLGALLPFKSDCQDWYWAEATVGDNSARAADNFAAQDNGCAGGWPGPDAAMLAALFREMHLGNLFGLGPYGSSDNCLNLSKLTLGGYSAGAQMVSRCMQEFQNPAWKYFGPKKDPHKLPKDEPDMNFPAIRAAMLLSGGSYFCYHGPGAWDADPKNLFSKNCGAMKCASCPPIMEGKTPQELRPLIGCCPVGKTEAFMEGTDNKAKLKHPPVILCQTYNDSDADCNASLTYAQALATQLKEAGSNDAQIDAGVQLVRTCWDSSKCNDRPMAVPRDAAISLSDCSSHTWFPEMIVPVTQFLLANTDAPEAPPDGFFSPMSTVPAALKNPPLDPSTCPSPSRG